MYAGALRRYNRDEAGIVLGTVQTLIGADPAIYCQNLKHKSITVQNTGPAPFATGVVEVAPSSTGPWATLIGIAGGTLGSAGIWNYDVENSYAYVRLGASVASGSVATVNTYVRF